MICRVCGIDKELIGFNFRKDSQKYRTECCECQYARTKEYIQRNKQKVLEYQRVYRLETTEKRAAMHKIYAPLYRERNLERLQVYKKNWRLENKDRINEQFREKMRTDLQFRLKRTLKARINMGLKKGYRSRDIIKMLQCSIPEFKKYIESQFQEGMTWENWTSNGWHMDHKKPLALFDLTDPKQVAEATHYTNFQPLWAIDNLKKGKKYEC